MNLKELKITTGIENNTEENQIIQECFSKYFSVKVSNDFIRLSDTDLALQITLGLVTSGLYDLLKLAIKSFLEKKTKRKKVVVWQRKTHKVVFTKEGSTAQSSEEFLKFDSVDDAIDFFKERKN